MASHIALTSNLTFANLNFSQNCNQVAKFTNLYFWGSRERFIQTYDALNSYVASALPQPAEEPTKCEVMGWFRQVYNHKNVTEYMYQIPFDNCLNETCQAIDYPGNADIAGIGVSHLSIWLHLQQLKMLKSGIDALSLFH